MPDYDLRTTELLTIDICEWNKGNNKSLLCVLKILSTEEYNLKLYFVD